jgi:hypothetical protein
MSDIRKVKIRAFAYSTLVDHPYAEGQKRLLKKVAVRNEDVDFETLTPRDKLRAEENDVFYKPGETPVDRPGIDDEGIADEAPTTTVVTSSEMDVQELATWIENDEPTVADLIEYVGSDPALAKRVIEAEGIATGGDPRKTLIAELKKVAATEDEED